MGLLKFEREEQDLGVFPEAGMEIMMGVGNPGSAFTLGQLPDQPGGPGRALAPGPPASVYMGLLKFERAEQDLDGFPEAGMGILGLLKFERTEQDLDEFPEVGMEIMMGAGKPESAFTIGRLPVGGIGLARLEVAINNAAGVHPKTLRSDALREREC